MFNIGGWELLVILVLALVVLGPDKLPEAAREFGRISGQLREMARGFQREFDSVKNDLTEVEARARGAAAVAANPGPGVKDRDRAVAEADQKPDVASSKTDDTNLDASPDQASTAPNSPGSEATDAGTASEGQTDDSSNGSDRPAPMADPFAGISRPSFDASAQPNRNVKPVSAQPQDLTDAPVEDR